MGDLDHGLLALRSVWWRGQLPTVLGSAQTLQEPPTRKAPPAPEARRGFSCGQDPRTEGYRRGALGAAEGSL
jgi:hypothetical protein